ncbi:MAG: nuclear transport factor 2 family protein [Sphingomonadales bacterium]|nr:MAG: nuclear transport factor 2 family protein [Sphingomonadales bacterium]
MSQTPKSLSAITSTLQRYFDGLYHCDLEALREVFHPNAIYVCATEDELTYRTMEEYFPIVAARIPPAAKGELRRDAIETISFAGPKTAFARVRCSIGNKYFTDFLTLIHQQDRWQIISKVFHFDLLDN